MPAAAADGWASPSGPPHDAGPPPFAGPLHDAGPVPLTGPGAAGIDPGLAPGFDPDHNWGLAGPAQPAAASTAAPARRRPRALVVALVLTYTGAALAVAELAGLLWTAWIAIGDDGDGPGAVPALGAVFDLWLLGLAWLMLAVGVVAAGVLTGRGRDGARVTLIGLLGVIALARLCGAGLAAMPRRSGAPDVEFVDLGVPGTLVTLVLGGLALAAVVLLVTKGVREHFSQVSPS